MWKLQMDKVNLKLESEIGKPQTESVDRKVLFEMQTDDINHNIK